MEIYFSPDLLLYCYHRIVLTEVGYLFNIVDQTVKHPLNIHFNPTSQGESIHPFAGPNVAENRFYNSHPFAVSTTPLWCVYLLLHFISKAAGTFTIEHMNLPRYRFGVAQTFGTQLAITASRLGCLIGDSLVSVRCTEIPVPYI